MADRVFVLAQLLRERADQLRRRLLRLADEKAVQLVAEELGAGRLLQRDANDVARLPAAGLLQERLLAVIGLGGIEPEDVAAAEVAALAHPAGEGARGLLDIPFRVVADAER